MSPIFWLIDRDLGLLCFEGGNLFQISILVSHNDGEDYFYF